MPYGSIAEAKKASFPTSAEDIELTLAQINKLAQIYDAIKAEGKVDNAMAVAWTSWKEVYEKKEDKWVKKNSEVANKIIILDAVDIGSEAPSRLQLLLKGLIKSEKGDFTLDDDGAEEILNYFDKRGIDLVIDYEHATLEKGMKAPAAGWIKKLSLNGGVWAEDIEWTEEAKKYLHLKEYRYFSPVVGVDKEDRAIMFHSIALTNVPAIEGQKPIINKHLIKGEKEMIEKIKKLLGLKDDTKEADVLTAVEGLQKNNVKEVVKVLSLKDDATMDDIKSAIEGLKKPAELSEVAKALSLKSDASLPDVLKSIEGLKVPGIAAQELSKEVVLLKNKLAEREQTELIELALKSGQTCKEELDKWGRELALKNPEQFKLIVLSRPDGSVVPLNKIDKGDPATKEHKQEIDEAQVKINKIMGISNEQFEKYAPKEVSV